MCTASSPRCIENDQTFLSQILASVNNDIKKIHILYSVMVKECEIRIHDHDVEQSELLVERFVSNVVFTESS